jgi:hypothetical protein
MKKVNLITLLSVLIICVFVVISCTENQQESSEDNPITDLNLEDIIKHGEYLVKIMGCNDCHSPKKMGADGPEIITELMLSGFPSDRPIFEFKDTLIKNGFTMFYPDLTAAAGPWGISFAGNLTPDETGIGNWSEEQFIKAFTQGKFKGLDNSRMLLPPMPVENYKNMKNEDVVAIFNYLKSIKPVSNIVPSPISPNEM